jgi:hypothetical protein
LFIRRQALTGPAVAFFLQAFDRGFFIEALESTSSGGFKPELFNIDRGLRHTSIDSINVLKSHNKGNIFARPSVLPAEGEQPEGKTHKKTLPGNGPKGEE